ncbi:MAG: hypothetical protein A3D96_04200 [Chlamydiae bacterium RIFCSPHIGHO2_12_FULL_44_59]|nr:MAG: hypothetical protein A2796_05690 [Chlamydiae bacterium RIFCSPHIGHO2_01_FULL_44_39]OGN57745.1 MAG: hypothetical protein A3C42_04270 [Chlamydiae bacterium RIFCSPHIGHO2_02_FULL_45_9]OGN60048.1 MAG: hypothetical protein A3D96_04200 [Chlamydiae bacterium RIFCSPHIGHO2_12_FULL_44_59]OGN68493.1 MAG: hypothetical protein A3I67_02145 [Chlamydiae bacterium RIFCSPLOWO2_02_FULL_45_22]
MLVLGYPKGLISVERKLVKRRYDVVCFMQTMKPLLLVECKATALDTKAAMQAFGYKGLLEAPFVTLIGPEEIMTYWQGKEGYEAVPFLPSHKELYAMSRRF